MTWSSKFLRHGASKVLQEFHPVCRLPSSYVSKLPRGKFVSSRELGFAGRSRLRQNLVLRYSRTTDLPAYEAVLETPQNSHSDGQLQSDYLLSLSQINDSLFRFEITYELSPHISSIMNSLTQETLQLIPKSRRPVP